MYVINKILTYQNHINKDQLEMKILLKNQYES